ncbi:MAG: T9SS type A sorting domain-containing protein, partial [Bacteroidales bacterium]|nr:T9SS type A sorting domain-containing protein [Bacteroidales bacterium]
MRKLLSFFLFAGLMAWAGVANAQQTITIGTGTDSAATVPINTVYKGSIVENIYLNSELNPNGTITSQNPVNITELAFYYAPLQSASTTWSHRVDIYLKHVSRSSFSSSTDRELIHADTNWVYGGLLTLNGSQRGWKTFTLPIPYLYTGGNLMVTFVIDSGASVSPAQHFFRYTNMSNNASFSYYPGGGPSNPDPLTRIIPRISGMSIYPCTSVSTRRANMRLTYQPVQAAQLPYTTNFSTASDNNQWIFKNWSLAQASWFFWSHSNPMLFCGMGQDDYDIDFEETVFVYRKLQPTFADSIKVEFDLTVGGEGGPTDGYPGDYYDYVSVFFVPGNINVHGMDELASSLLGSSDDFGYTDGSYEWLRFGRDSLIGNYKLAHRSGERMSCTFPNKWRSQQCNLVFVWSNDGSDGDGYAVQIDNVSVSEVSRGQEYTPQSTKQWYAYAYWLSGDNKYPWQEHFLKFSMQNLANVDTASAHFDDDIYSGTYAGNYVWYNQGELDKVTRANINNGFISGAICYTLASSLSSGIAAMQYNPADSKMYFITNDKKLCNFDISDPEHYTIMGQLSINIATFAINAQGQAYVLENNSNGSLYRVNLNNGTTTLVGSSGIHIENYSSMAFDYSTGELFVALYDDDDYDDGYGSTAIYYVNTTNGEMKYIGKLLDRPVEISAMFAEQTAVQQGIATAQAAELSVYPNPAKDELHVNGVEANTIIRIYDMTGKVVMQQTATDNTTINISELNRGVYVVSAGASKIKFVKE